MLKRFILENFSSYRDENILELTAGRTELHPNHLVEYPKQKIKILKSAVIYGANASGKSNLIKGMEYAKNIIIRGFNEVETYKKYFRLDKNCSKKVTQFEFELELNDKFYSYGFSAFLDKKIIEEEWLFEIGKSSDDLIFERKKTNIILGSKLTKNKKIKNRFDIYIEDMKNQTHQLFLSEISDKNLDSVESKIFNDIYHWFDEKLIILYPNTKFSNISSIGNDDNLSKIFKKYLKRFDTGIIDILLIEEDFEESFKEFSKAIKLDIEKNLIQKGKKRATLRSNKGHLLTICRDDSNNELKIQKLGLVHSNKVDDIFELHDESDGSKRLIDFIPLIPKFNDDYTILIDEFDRSLHPKLTKDFFKLFYELNNFKSQLIVSTHESTLLDLTLLRRDEIWFAEKDKSGASKLFTLNQFKERYDKKIEKAYLSGRYGAIPIFQDFDELEMDK